MSSSKLPPPPPPPPFYYIYLPTEPQDHQDSVVLLPYHPNTRRHRLCTASLIMMIIALVSLITYISWPSNPDLKIERMELTRAVIRRAPQILVDATLSLTIKVHNPDVYSLDYSMLDATVGYRGKELGRASSQGGHVRALGSSYMEAELELHGGDLLSDVLFLLEDLTKGEVPFDTVTEVTGLSFFRFPLKAKVYCEILVNTRNQTFVRTNCYPE